MIEEAEDVKRTWGIVVSISVTLKVKVVSALSKEPSFAFTTKVSVLTSAASEASV